MGFGPLAPAGEVPYTVRELFGRAPSPLVMTAGPSGNYLEIGGYDFPVAEPMSGVQTVDAGFGPVNAVEHAPSARNLLRPMHSEAFWVLMLALAALGLFSVAGRLQLGPVKFAGEVGK